MALSATTARTYVSIPDAHLMGQSELDAMYTAIKDANITTVRIFAPWATVQPTNPTTYTWVGVDRAVNRALLKGLQLIVVLAPPRPGWAAVDFDPALFAGFAGTVAARYKVRGRGLTVANRLKSVTQFQIWDEPNVAAAGNYLLPGVYARLMRKVYPAVKKGQPGSVVILGALQACRTKFFGPQRAVDPVGYLSMFYVSGGRNAFDAAAYNPLSKGTVQQPVPPPPSVSVIRQSDDLRAAMVLSGDRNKKLHWSSIGYDTTHFTELQQAEYLETMRRFAEARADHVCGLGIHTYRDDDEGS